MISEAVPPGPTSFVPHCPALWRLRSTPWLESPNAFGKGPQWDHTPCSRLPLHYSDQTGHHPPDTRIKISPSGGCDSRLAARNCRDNPSLWWSKETAEQANAEAGGGKATEYGETMNIIKYKYNKFWASGFMLHRQVMAKDRFQRGDSVVVIHGSLHSFGFSCLRLSLMS